MISDQQKAYLSRIHSELRFIEKNLRAIDFETNKGLKSQVFSSGYIFEKTDKAKSSLEIIEQMTKYFYDSP